MNKLSTWSLESFEEVVHKNDLEEENHRKNTVFTQREDLVAELFERTNVVGKTDKITNASEAVADKMLESEMEVFNGTKGIFPESMPEKYKEKFRDQYAGYLSHSGSGSPDFVCFGHYSINNIFFIEVKKAKDRLSDSQYAWLNENKWAETFVLRVKKENTFTQDDLITNSDVVDLDGVNLKQLIT